MNSDLLYEKWKSEFTKLENELSQFRNYFVSVKNCNCDIRECRHYKKARHQIFGDRIDKLFNMRLQASIQFHNETSLMHRI